MTEHSGEKRSWTDRIKRIFGTDQDSENETQQRTLHKLGTDVITDRKLEERIKLLMDFEERIKSPIETDDLKEYVRILHERNDLIHFVIVQSVYPYARSGDYPMFGRMLHGWGRLYACSSSWILRTEDSVLTSQRAKDQMEKPKDQQQKDQEPDQDKTSIKGLVKLDDPGRIQTTRNKSTDVKTLSVLLRNNCQKHPEKRSMDLMEIETMDVRMLVRFLHDVLQKHIWPDAFLVMAKSFRDPDVSLHSATVIQNVNPQRDREDMRSTPDFG